MSKETAWSSWDEWRFVKKQFASECYDKELEAIKLVNMWKSRVRGGALPISVELTKTLIASKHKLNKTAQINNHDACLCAAMALVRFINGITDQFQTGVYAQAVQNIADKIEIPDWMVDLRHEATHGQLPSFEVLQSGINFGLGWLFRNYWEETSLKIEEDMNKFYSNALDKIKSYTVLVFEGLSSNLDKNGAETKKEKRKSNKNDYDREMLVNGLLKIVNQSNFKMVVNMLTHSDGFMVNQNKPTENNFSVKLFDEHEQKVPLIRCFSAAWKPLLESLQRKFPQFIELLIENLVTVYEKSIDQYELVSLSIALYTCASASGSCNAALLNSVSYLLKYPSDLGFRMLKMLCEDDVFEGKFKHKLIVLLSTFGRTIQSLQNRVSVNWREYLGSNQTCVMFKDAIDKVRDGSLKLVDKQGSNSSRWRRLSDQEMAILPPMGDFDYRTHLCGVLSHSRIIKIMDTDFDGTVSFQINNNSSYHNGELGRLIENLFDDNNDVNFIDDGGSSDSGSDSCATEGYNEDVDMPWFDDVEQDDVDAFKEINEKKFDSLDYASKISVDASTIDVSKVMLF